MTQELEAKEREILERQEVVHRDLAMAEPALLDAQAAVSNIQRKFLDELRMMGQPPVLVKLTLEAVLCLINNTGKAPEWAAIRKQMHGDGFI